MGGTAFRRANILAFKGCLYVYNNLKMYHII